MVRTLITSIRFLVDPYIFNYLHSHWTNGVNAQSVADTTAYDNIHTTDVTNKKALDMIDEAANDGNQFFMMVASGKSVLSLKLIKCAYRLHSGATSPIRRESHGSASSIEVRQYIHGSPGSKGGKFQSNHS